MLIETSKRLAQQAYEKILELILSGEAEPGEMLTERRLAETLDMSRTPIRDALLMLESEGLLKRHGSRGLQVKQMRIEDYMEVLQIRLLLEPEAARLAAGHLSAETISDLRKRLHDLIDGAEKGATRPDREAVRAVDDGLHGAIANMAGNAHLAQIIHSLRRQTQIFDLRSIPERLTSTCQEHLALIDLLEQGKSEEAAEAMREHLDHVRASIIRRLTPQ
ncbi:GntR family transcriptional regulator [uncultured Cohaesibacter sp.]|uniref:GntR family transcriptional regulator n=1 Tax=uncultured Cohaesibacter sp. TaxID=1002546 RepID=UPI002AAADC8D|nr:GntR family transcriptional regulator [uncultured Cohaesibacter sp.]